MYTVKKEVRKANNILKKNNIKLDTKVVTNNSVRTSCRLYLTNGKVHSVVKVGWLIRMGQLLDLYSLVFVLLHEYGHGFIYSRWDRMLPKDQKLWTNTFGDFSEHASTRTTLSKLIRTGMKYNRSEYNTWYSTTSSHEDWAECFAMVLSGKTSRGDTKAARKLKAARFLIKKYAE